MTSRPSNLDATLWEGHISRELVKFPEKKVLFVFSKVNKWPIIDPYVLTYLAYIVAVPVHRPLSGYILSYLIFFTEMYNILGNNKRKICYDFIWY